MWRSVSVRDCQDIVCIVACQQYRVRDCKKLTTLLYVGGDPAVETSENLKFGCFQYSYPALKEQFANAQLSVHNNQWSRVHDFIGPSGTASGWKFLPEDEADPLALLKRVSELSSDAMTRQEEESFSLDPVVPQTWGRRPPADEQNCVLVLVWSPDTASKAYSAIGTHQKSPL